MNPAVVVEAVRFNSWGQWHAVLTPGRDDATTVCRRDRAKAEDTMRDWWSSDLEPKDRCQTCSKAAEIPVERHRVRELDDSGAECSCGRYWTFWGSAHSTREGARNSGRIVRLLQATARRHAKARNASAPTQKSSDLGDI